jgi:hypothetical protein
MHPLQLVELRRVELEDVPIGAVELAALAGAGPLAGEDLEPAEAQAGWLDVRVARVQARLPQVGDQLADGTAGDVQAGGELVLAVGADGTATVAGPGGRRHEPVELEVEGPERADPAHDGTPVPWCLSVRPAMLIVPS